MRGESNSENKQEKPSSSIFIVGGILYTDIKITLILHISGALTWILNRHFPCIVLGPTNLSQAKSLLYYAKSNMQTIPGYSMMLLCLCLIVDTFKV